MAKKNQEQETKIIKVAGVAIVVDASDAERILSREWAVLSSEGQSTFTTTVDGSGVTLANHITGTPMTVYVQRVNGDRDYTRAALRPQVNRPSSNRETR
jgi:hypothetical protein